MSFTNMKDATIQPVKNTQTKPLPPHSDPKECYMGADTGVNGSMGDYSRGVTNTE